MNKHILVLFHEREMEQQFDRFAVFYFASYWRDAGYKVTFQKGIKTFINADLVFVHVNLTVVPDEYLEYAMKYPLVINGEVKDIRKSVISENLVHAGENWNGPVIVKSNLNYGGQPEHYLNSFLHFRDNSLFRNILKIGDKLSGKMNRTPYLSWHDYQVFKSLDDVPEKYRKDPRVIYERFLPEYENGVYHVRLFQFFGDRWSCIRLSSNEPVIKAENSFKVENIQPHPAVVNWRRKLNMDYGKFDYVIYNGNPVLLDANKTIGVSRDGVAYNKELIERQRNRALGIESFFAGYDRNDDKFISIDNHG